jgi:hypothetical protein
MECSNLKKKMNGLLYERTALSKKPELVAQAELENLRKEDVFTPKPFEDFKFTTPYQDESLYDFCQRLAYRVEEEGQGV